MRYAKKDQNNKYYLKEVSLATSDIYNKTLQIMHKYEMQC